MILQMDIILFPAVSIAEIDRRINVKPYTQAVSKILTFHVSRRRPASDAPLIVGQLGMVV
jgi:hypothetical protein